MRSIAAWSRSSLTHEFPAASVVAISKYLKALKMKFNRWGEFAAICLFLVFAQAMNAAAAKEIKLGWNVRNAGRIMYAAAAIDKNATGVDAAPKILKDYHLTYYRQWNNRFKEDLGFLFAVNKSHVFIAFRGTSNKANEAMNEDGRPELEYLTRVHTGWWRAAKKAWNDELSKLVRDKLGNRTILVIGHSMGGAVAAYVVKLMQHDRGKKKALKDDTPLRLVTFGAPRYTFNKKFFAKKKTLIFTVEAAMNDQCVDKVVWDWQVNLRKHHPLYKKADIQKPTRDKGTYYRRCKTDTTHQKDAKGNTNTNSVHAFYNYYERIVKKGVCEYVKYKSCSPYGKYVD